MKIQRLTLLILCMALLNTVFGHRKRFQAKVDLKECSLESRKCEIGKESQTVCDNYEQKCVKAYPSRFVPDDFKPKHKETEKPAEKEKPAETEKPTEKPTEKHDVSKPTDHSVPAATPSPHSGGITRPRSKDIYVKKTKNRSRSNDIINHADLANLKNLTLG